ncbi:hypothetical protein [Wolbachia endosymbiont (group A) of Scambus nigricans]|uniref:hypothetical protein n=1 Tax=Wolbachia endosymbiont (group A) of Scambus nigricans TaxID=2954055 RepID=UPI002231ECAE|nr:hypothetical protein [Wolbachia endosymbiont (group A) of Scambus nigricans]
MLLACYSHKHISYRIRTIIRKAIKSTSKIINRIHSAINKQLLMQKLPSISIIYGNIAQKQAAKSTSGAF